MSRWKLGAAAFLAIFFAQFVWECAKQSKHFNAYQYTMVFYPNLSSMRDVLNRFGYDGWVAVDRGPTATSDCYEYPGTERCYFTLFRRQLPWVKTFGNYREQDATHPAKEPQ